MRRRIVRRLSKSQLVSIMDNLQENQEVNFRLDSRPFVPTLINGKGPFWLLLDTGCIGCRITPQIAETLGTKADKDGIICLQTIEIGSAKWENIRFGVGDESAAKRFLRRDFDGFLGNGFLYYVREQSYMVLDYLRQTIAFRKIRDTSNQNLQKCSENFSVVPISLENYYTIVPVHVNGKGPYRFLLDTGAGCCIVSDILAESLNLPKGNVCQATGPEVSIDAYDSSVSKLSVGSVSLENLGVMVMNCSHVTGYVHDRIDGYIGTNFLQHFVITLKYRDRTPTFGRQ